MILSKLVGKLLLSVLEIVGEFIRQHLKDVV